MFNSFFSISFEYPYILILILVFIFCFIFCRAKTATMYLPHLNIFKKANKKHSYFLSILKYLVAIFSIIALASPVKINDTQLIKNDGINIVLNLDASGSMKSKDLDYRLNRFDVVKNIVKDFIQKRVNDNVALVVFGDSALLASPLSFDKEAQSDILQYLEVQMAGQKTALYDSIVTSVNILKDKKAKSNIIIILSDGIDNSSKIPLEVVLKFLKKYSIKAYTIGIGNSNKYTLDTIAKSSNAKSYTAFSKDDLGLIYEDINKLEKSKIDKNKIVLKEYLFFYPLFLASLCLILLIYLRNKE